MTCGFDHQCLRLVEYRCSAIHCQCRRARESRVTVDFPATAQPPGSLRLDFIDVGWEFPSPTLPGYPAGVLLFRIWLTGSYESAGSH
eukprot:1935241-Rhodomonas_salina.5